MEPPEGEGGPAALETLVGAAMARRIEHAARSFRARPGVARIVVDADADGLSAAGILVTALMREGRMFHLTALRGLGGEEAKALSSDKPPVLITSDVGSGQADLLEPIADAGTLVLILDHHVPRSGRSDDKFVQVNGHLFGVDGSSELCGASTSFLFALALDPANIDLAPLAIAGAIGDRQHVGGFRGAAQRIVQAATAAGVLEVRRGLNLDGDDMLEALVRSNDPFLPGVTGDEAAARALLREVGVAPDTPVGKVPEAPARALASRLAALLLEHGVDAFYAQEVTTQRVEIPSRSMTAKELQALINSAGRAGDHGAAVGVALGQPWAFERARAHANAYRDQVRAGLLRLVAEPPHKLKAVQYFDTDNTLVAAAVAGLGVIYLFDPAYPVVCFSPQGGGWKISTRATRGQRERGVDFAVAARKAAESVGGRGGGHPVASGATIPREGRERFLEEIDAIVASQLKAGAKAPA
jgi:hypothetical protein